jgi:AbrB family looped-hinge helix DNA binding protein
MAEGSPVMHHLFGIVRVDKKGKVAIPKRAREIFSIKPGDPVLVVGDEQERIAIMKA